MPSQTPMIDLLVVTQLKTLPLFDVFYASLCRFFKSPYRLLIVSEAETIAVLRQRSFPENVELIEIEELLPDRPKYNGYKVCQYVKLKMAQRVKTPYYLIMDDDFLLVRPMVLDQFFFEGKPFWFYETWERSGSNVRWRKPMERFFGFDPPYAFLTNSTFLLKTDIVRRLDAEHDLTAILHYDDFGECQGYATYAHARFHNDYHWINNYWGDEVLMRRINQQPPTHMSLDPTIAPESFKAFHYLAFWSHWSACESKMKAFLEAAP